MDIFGLMLALLSWILLLTGYIFTFGLLCVPSVRLYKLWEAEEGVDHMPVLYLMSLFNALTWFAYGFLDPQSKAVMFINLFAAIVHLVYVIWYICVCSLSSSKMGTSFALAIVLLFFGFMAGIHALFPGTILGSAGRDSLNVPVMITSALMYLAPIPDTVNALWTQDPGRVSIPIAVAALGNAFCWGEYGRVQGEIIIRRSNEWGMVSPILQIVAYLVLRRTELRQIFREEIPQFITETVPQAFRDGYIYLRRDEEEDDA